MSDTRIDMSVQILSEIASETWALLIKYKINPSPLENEIIFV